MAVALLLLLAPNLLKDLPSSALAAVVIASAIGSVQAYMGHRKPENAQLYTKMSPERFRNF